MVDRRFLNFHITIKKIANFPDSGYVAGDQYIVGATPNSEFMNANPNDIAVYDGSKWDFIPPQATTSEVINVNTGEVLYFNGTNWVKILSIEAPSYTIEEYELTDTEISNKRLTLQHSIRDNFEVNTTILFSGATFFHGVDFTASGNTISFSNNFLRNRLQAGDVVYIQYVRA